MTLSATAEPQLTVHPGNCHAQLLHKGIVKTETWLERCAWSSNCCSAATTVLAVGRLIAALL
jgi:hypothetical protein